MAETGLLSRQSAYTEVNMIWRIVNQQLLGHRGHFSQSWVLHEHVRPRCSIQTLDTASCISVALTLRPCGKNRGNLRWVLLLWTLSSIKKTMCIWGTTVGSRQASLYFSTVQLTSFMQFAMADMYKYHEHGLSILCLFQTGQLLCIFILSIKST